ncbi:MAG: pyrimidine-nucleoside phosphorylase [Clostridiales bacterium]|nr:pyrimidine-nucleoside phosphorylase [Clostridiales bacterium]
MRMVDLIDRKKNGKELTEEEIAYFIRGYVAGEIPDYQVSALLMAVCFQGMTSRELTQLTLEMAKSGEMMDLSAIHGCKVDKHSTGGVGDKTTLVIVPIVAACGGKVAKMSGRGLGFTGGTIDKLEAIPGFATQITKRRFFEIVNQAGASVMGQSGNITPADKKLYALRDVTATVDSIPLIASSVMSKKLAAGSDAILLDVTCGSGAFMQSREQAEELAEKMVGIGTDAGKKMTALITNMDVPLGNSVGNILEVKEAIEVLRGKGPEDTREICFSFAVEMLLLSGSGSREECEEKVKDAVESGAALRKLMEIVRLQGGDDSYIQEPERFPKAAYFYEVAAQTSGYVTSMDTKQCGIVSGMLGAGRETMDSELDYTAGLYICKKTGDKVSVGETLVTLYSNSYDRILAAEPVIRSAYKITGEKPEKQPLIYKRITG